MALSADQVAKAALEGGWPKELVPKVLGVSKCESSWNAAARGPRDSAGNVPIGLMQVKAPMHDSAEALTDPVHNMRVSWRLYQETKARGRAGRGNPDPGWLPWACRDAREINPDDSGWQNWLPKPFGIGPGDIDNPADIPGQVIKGIIEPIREMIGPLGKTIAFTIGGALLALVGVVLIGTETGMASKAVRTVAPAPVRQAVRTVKRVR